MSVERVQCCLGCCLSHWVRQLGLLANALHWQRSGKNFYVSSGTGALEEAATATTAPSSIQMPLTSVLWHRFGICQFAHVQAVSLSDWTALSDTASHPQGLSHDVRFFAPSAASVNATLICLNGFGRMLGSARSTASNANDGSGISSRSSSTPPALYHRTRTGDGRTFEFADPIAPILGALNPEGRHAVYYGDDPSLTRWLLHKHYTRHGPRLHHWYAPNLSPDAVGDLASTVPLGLNSNARAHSQRLPSAGPLRAATVANARNGSRMSSAARPLAPFLSHALLPSTESPSHPPVTLSTHRPHQSNARPPAQGAHGDDGGAPIHAQLLCCCMAAYPHRVAVAERLRRNGFHTCHIGEASRLSWQQTMAQYAEHRFVLAIHGKGHNDFRVWEALHAGAIPVVQRFPEQDSLLRGLPVVRVANWSTFTPSTLHDEGERIAEGLASQQLGLQKLFAPFWFGVMTSHMPEVT